MGNGAKAQQKRERNAKDAAKGASSQLKVNQKALSVQCTVCKQTFLQTIKRPALEQHMEKHAGKDFNTCFPNFSG
ncbi:At2g23090 like protein [Gorgonomyces haynaldii]|nr:At2g23090 like protein [Gorgonomyces haynaldii]